MKHYTRILPLFALLPLLSAAAAEKPNVLFICVDDLRPQLGCYGEQIMVTPHLDKLASQGRRFDRHYVAVPTCGASRFALMTGRRPSNTGGMNNDAFGKLSDTEKVPAPETFAHLFRINGYRTVGIGKVGHSPDGLVYGYNKPPADVKEMPRSWDDFRLPLGQWNHGWDSFFAYADGTGRNWRRTQKIPSPPVEAAEVADTGYPDGLVARDAIAQLKELKNREEPFLLAVGFFKPHLPFNAPQKYWDLYPPEKVELAPTATEGKQTGAEMFGYNHPPGSRSDPNHHRHLRRAYFASVSYIDAQVGMVLDSLDELGLAGNTIVIVWGDHGWHLGDLSHWGKHTLHEWSLRSPLIVRTPNMPQPGKPARGIVETIDLYPTLVDYCALADAPEILDGASLRPLLENAGHAGKTAAIGYWEKGRTIRIDRYRLIVPDMKKPDNMSLYDLENDPDEANDIADENHDRGAELLKQLREDQPRMQ